MRNSAQQAGFTIIELMIAVAILAIFVVIGVPSFQNSIRQNRMTTQANDLVASVHLARSEAIKRRSSVVVCRSNAANTACATNTSGFWEFGWHVFVDDNNNGDLDAGELLIKTFTDAENTTIRPGAVAFRDEITFRVNGILQGAASSFLICDEKTANAAEGRTVAVNVAGKVSTTKGATACP